MKVEANGIQIEVEDSGGEGRPVVMLIMGLGMQLIAWPEPMVQGLIDAGFRVVRHDNRDAGLSDAFDAAGNVNLLWQGIRHRLGLSVHSIYTLQDMADDAVGVLDALGIAQAHVVGVSRGGMIAQRMAASAPTRVASLVSIMSSSGARGLPGPRADVLATLMRRPAGRDEAALVANSVRFIRLIGGPTYRQDDAVVAARVTRAMRRAYRPEGLLRQMAAVGADQSRAALLPRIACPTLVLHGDTDALVPHACGQDTARRIPGATFVTVPGMGHDLPPPVVDLLLDEMLPFFRSVELSTAA